MITSKSDKENTDAMADRCKRLNKLLCISKHIAEQGPEKNSMLYKLNKKGGVQ